MGDIEMVTMRADTASLSAAKTSGGGDRNLIMHSGLLINPKISTQLAWGRATGGRTWFRSLLAASPVVLAPLASLTAFVTLARYNGALSEFLAAGFQEGFLAILVRHAPTLTLKASAVYGLYLLLQAALFHWLPGPTSSGQRTPAGHLLTYRTNGLAAWVVTHVLYALLSWYGVLDPGFVPRNWSGLVAAMSFMGFLVTTLAFVKAYAFPTHTEDRKFSGTSGVWSVASSPDRAQALSSGPPGLWRTTRVSQVASANHVFVGSAAYDYYMGIELNPRFGETFDFKLFTNGRPGMLSWTLM